MLQGFKDFIMKGNVLDLAVAVIIGAAFGKIVNALVEAVLMPLIAAAVYVAIVMPMNKMIEARNRRLGIDPAEEEVPADVAVLTEIRDLLAERRGGPTSGTTTL